MATTPTDPMVAGSDYTAIFTPDTYPLDATPTVTVTRDGADVTPAASVTADAAGERYLLTLAAGEVEAGSYRFAWVGVAGGDTFTDVEYIECVEVEPPSHLASTTDLVAFGYSPDSADMLGRASVRVRGYTKQTITRATSTVTLTYPYLLPQRPVASVTSVVDEAGQTLTEGTSGDYVVRGQYIVTSHKGPLTVTYTHGFATLPAELVELVCQVAARMHDQPHGLKVGVMQDGASGEQMTYGSSAYSGVADLTPDEKRVLDRIFPHTRSVPSVAVTL